jgi:cysteinyl-tRNA synthetase
MECSVMSGHFLGSSFDIHGGGEDLLFPHHENERAQSIAANGGRFARYWIHNGFVTVESEKMSKSLGNFLTIRDALHMYHPEVLRLFLLSKHYRSPLDFSRSAVLALQAGLVRIYRTLQRLDQLIGPDKDKGTGPVSSSLSAPEKDSFLDQFVQAMDDDLNTANAIALLFEKVKEMNKTMDSPLDDSSKAGLSLERRQLYVAAAVLGFLHEEPEAFFEALAASTQGADSGEIQKLIEERTSARKNKDWARADAIRQRLKNMGIVLEDGPKGTTWRYDV